jgi:hypothetical protein
MNFSFRPPPKATARISLNVPFKGLCIFRGRLISYPENHFSPLDIVLFLESNPVKPDIQ